MQLNLRKQRRIGPGFKEPISRKKKEKSAGSGRVESAATITGVSFPG